MDDRSWKDKIVLMGSGSGEFAKQMLEAAKGIEEIAAFDKAQEIALKNHASMLGIDADILDRYNTMVAEMVLANIYDGRGTYDLYYCEKCHKSKITTYAVKGVTPFMIGCSCGGTMSHTKTSREKPHIFRIEKWIRPSVEQLKYFSPSTIEHILNGGLILESELHLKMLVAQVAAKEAVVLEPPKLKMGEIIEYEPPKKAKYRDTHCSGVQIAKRRKKNKNKKTHRR